MSITNTLRKELDIPPETTIHRHKTSDEAVTEAIEKLEDKITELKEELQEQEDKIRNLESSLKK